MTDELTIEDRVELHELAARYGNVIDARAWDRLGSVFAADASFALTGFGDDGRWDGLAAIRAMLEGGRHPVAHHVTNVEVDGTGGEVRLFFKIVGPGPRGRVGSADYDDVARRGPDGWRIITHRVTLRRPLEQPGG
jgi:3-phenylpropionate/cinnamic acid dioxygenase small subunit